MKEKNIDNETPLFLEISKWLLETQVCISEEVRPKKKDPAWTGDIYSYVDRELAWHTQNTCQDPQYQTNPAWWQETVIVDKRISHSCRIALYSKFKVIQLK